MRLSALESYSKAWPVTDLSISVDLGLRQEQHIGTWIYSIVEL
jgi:hypothetical protein